MSARHIWILAAVLAIQAGVIIGVRVSEARNSYSGPANGPLLQAHFASLQRIMIRDGDHHSVTLEKSAQRWLLPGLYGLPADTSAVSGLLAKLGSLRHDWAVADTPGAARRFKVARSDFRRRIALLGGGGKPLGVVYLGTSPAFRRTYVRVGGERRIYEEGIQTYQVSAEPGHWLDRQLLALDTGDLQRIRGPDYTLLRSGHGWKLQGLDTGQKTSGAAVGKLLGALGGLSVESALGPQLPAAYGPRQPAAQFVFTTAKGRRLVYRIDAVMARTRPGGQHVAVKAGRARTYVLKASDRPEYFKLAGWEYHSLAAIKRSTLVTAQNAGGHKRTAVASKPTRPRSSPE